MALSPASSRGAAAFNGGTITTPLVLAMASAADTALTINPPATVAGGTNLIQATDKTGTQIFGLTARADLLVDGTQQDGSIELDGGGNGTVALNSSLGTAGTKVFGLVAPNGEKTTVITSGALPTVAPVSATAFQCTTSRDVNLWVPVTYNPGVATTATCKVELSPDNVTFSTLATVTQPVGTVFDGSIEPVILRVPAGWYVKLTVTNATLGTGTYY